MRYRFPHLALLLSILLPLWCAASETNGQSASPTEGNPDRINTIFAGYDLYTLRPKAAAAFSLNGVVIGYNIDFRITRNHPLYIGTGVDARLTFRDKTVHDTATYDEIKAKVSTRFLNFNIPLNLSYRLPVSDLLYVIPQIGLDFRIQALGKKTTTISSPAKPEVMAKTSGFTPGSVNLFSKNALGPQALRRFQAGWHAALKLQYDQFVLGISYGTDFAKLRNELGSSNLLVNLGYMF